MKSVAWFKLAELVSRGEKEKALNLYRLLSHSFDERAYVLQLEGDILWAFEDNQALDRYQQAAFLYQKEQKLASAVAVYEHLFTLQPDNPEFVSQLVLLYTRLAWALKFEHYFSILLSLFEKEMVSQDFVWGVIEEVALAASGDGALGKALIDLLQKKASHLVKKAKALLG